MSRNRNRHDGRSASRREGRRAAPTAPATPIVEAQVVESPIPAAPDDANLDGATPAPTARSSTARPLFLFVGVSFALFLLGAATLRLAAAAYLERLPENYAAKARAAVDRRDVVAAADAIDAELALRPYNFEARHAFAELAIARHAELAEPMSAQLLRAAASRLFQGFESFQAIGDRDVHAAGWSEGKALADIARLLAALGRHDQAARAWGAAADADPAWTPSRRAAWESAWPREAFATAQAIERSRKPCVAPDANPPSDSVPLFVAATLPEGATFPDPADARARVIADSTAPGGRAILLFRRGAFDATRFAVSADSAATLPVATSAEAGQRLLVAARGTPAFGGWPVVFVEAASEGATKREALAFLRIGPGTEWRLIEARLTRPLELGERIVFSYWNDAYDAATKDDRNVFLAWAALAP